MAPITAVLLYAAWTLLLPVAYAAIRAPLILTRRRRADAWERGQPNIDPPVIVRMKHAHLNCVENFAVFAAVVFAAMLLDRTAAVSSLAPWVLYARIAQSVVHVSGTSFAQVLIRGALYAAQIALIAIMIAALLH